MLSITTVLLILLLLLFLWKFSDIKKIVLPMVYLEKLPGPAKPHYFSGNAILFYNKSNDEMFKVLRKWSQEYYPINKISLFPYNTVSILSPEDCEKILANPVHANKSAIYRLLERWLRQGLLTSNDEKWQRRRKILTPAFHFSILQQFLRVFNEETDNLVEILRVESRKNPVIEINQHITQFTLKTIAETAMGTKLTFETEEQKQYKQAILDIVDALLYKLFHPWLPILERVFIRTEYFYKEAKALKVLHKFTSDVIAEREANFTGIPEETENHDVYKGKKRLAMLDLMLAAKNNDKTIDREGIHEEVDTFMFEGHDTTAVALNFNLMLIACNRHVQERIVEEIQAILGPEMKKKPTFNDLQEMKYLERCIKEGLRMYPSVHYISRELGENLTSASGYFLPKGSIAHIHIYDIHMNPMFYPEPDKYDPDRFLPENCQKRNPFAYLPFSAGPRNCIGQKFAMLELKAAIVGILANFLLEPVDTPDSISLVLDIVLRSTKSIKVKFLERQQSQAESLELY